MRRFLTRLTNSHCIGQNHVRGMYAHFYSSNLNGIMFEVTLYVQQGSSLILSQNGYQILCFTSSNG